MSRVLVLQGIRPTGTELGTTPGAQPYVGGDRCRPRVARHRLIPDAGAGPVRSMTHNHDGAEAPTPIHAMFDLDDLQAHYGIGKTKATELVNQPGFLTSVVPGMHRYPAAAVEAYGLAVALAGTVADPAKAVPPAPVVIAPPAPGRPGPKPRSASNRKGA